MSIRIGINGFGRIGRNVLRAIYENNRRGEVEVVGINDLMDVNTAAFLLKHDSVHGLFKGDVHVDGNDLIVNGDRIMLTALRNPAELPWKKLNVDVVCECTGLFLEASKAKMHIEAGAKKVLISAPAGKDVEATIVYGVNHRTLKSSDLIVSNASCTTNCLAPMVKPLHEKIGLLRGLMVTIHSYTNDQVLIDGPHKDIRRARAAAVSMIPTKTGAAAAVGLVLPELKGLLDGYAMRVPTINVSIVDLTFEAKRDTTTEEINKIIKAASEGELKGILAYNEEPLVSCDFNHHTASSNFDATLTRVIGRTVKVCSWYDNEWGFSNRMIDVCLAMMNAK
jgi:glyceraldehyde 3-phosphate dehydrogenase